MTNNPAQGLNLSQLAAQANNQFGNAYNVYAQQGQSQTIAAIQHQAAQQAAWGAQQVAARKHMWMWNGVAMDVVDFAKHAYGDTPEATHFILKYKDAL
jgi:hypothetical protein